MHRVFFSFAQGEKKFVKNEGEIVRVRNTLHLGSEPLLVVFTNTCFMSLILFFVHNCNYVCTTLCNRAWAEPFPRVSDPFCKKNASFGCGYVPLMEIFVVLFNNLWGFIFSFSIFCQFISFAIRLWSYFRQNLHKNDLFNPL